VEGYPMSEPNLPVATEGPFLGMMANSRIDTPPGYLAYIKNLFCQDGVLVTRPGLDQIGNAIGSGNDVQGIYQWEMLDGTAYTCAFSNGDLWVYSWAGDNWTQYDLSAEGLTVSTTGDINCCTSRGRLICTDGVNKPFMITGELGGVGESFDELTNAPIAHRCGVYYDKVFFWDIPDYENEFQWSDEGDPENGYSGEDQAWEFAQTDAGKILGMAPLNERNVILKQDSATMLMGDADENFSTLAVREGLSETEGTIAGGSVVVLDGDVYHLSANGPRRVRSGSSLESLHESNGVDLLLDEWLNVNRSAWSSSLGFVDRTEKMVGWLVPQGVASTLNTALVFNTQNASWSTFEFSGFEFTAVGSVEDTSGNEWILFGDTDGKVYRYRVGFGQYSDAGTAIEYKARKRISDGTITKKRIRELHLLFDIVTEVDGEIRPYIDSTVLDGKRFGKSDKTGEFRYRRGMNSCGFEVGWEFWCQSTAASFRILKAHALMSVIELGDDWNG
jgi:hypothetical protein